MWDQDAAFEPTVFRLDQKRGPVVERALYGSEREWPLTLTDCQTALLGLLPKVSDRRVGYADYWRWVGRTHNQMKLLYSGHVETCRARQSWQLGSLLRLRWRLEMVTLRLLVAPWLPSRAEAAVVGLQQFSRLTA